VEYDDDTYKIHVKVENFKPEELIVKTVDNTVQVDGQPIPAIPAQGQGFHSSATYIYRDKKMLPIVLLAN
jgi:hypothetical protein